MRVDSDQSGEIWKREALLFGLRCSLNHRLSDKWPGWFGRDHEESSHMLKSTLEEQLQQNDLLRLQLGRKRAECEELQLVSPRLWQQLGDYWWFIAISHCNRLSSKSLSGGKHWKPKFVRTSDFIAWMVQRQLFDIASGSLSWQNELLKGMTLGRRCKECEPWSASWRTAMIWLGLSIGALSGSCLRVF